MFLYFAKMKLCFVSTCLAVTLTIFSAVKSYSQEIDREVVALAASFPGVSDYDRQIGELYGVGLDTLQLIADCPSSEQMGHFLIWFSGGSGSSVV